MQNVWVRPIVNTTKNKEGKTVWSPEYNLFVEWLYANRALNRFDPELYETNQDGTFKRCNVWVLYTDEGIIGFIPVTIAFQVESMAFKPELSPVLEARALQAMQHHLVFEAKRQGISDAFFITIDGRVIDFAEKYGWKKPTVPVLNLHVADLEKRDGRTVTSEQG